MASHNSTLTISLMLIFSTLSYIHRRTDDKVTALYESWLIEHERSYNALGEKDNNFQIFKDNLKYIDEHNSVLNQSYKLRLTKFTDLTNQEYKLIYLGAKSSGDRRKLSKNKNDRYLPKVGDNLPESVDLRKKSVIVDVKDKGDCGCCWAFCAVASIESINAIVTGDLISLSEQELVDYDTSLNNGSFFINM